MLIGATTSVSKASQICWRRLDCQMKAYSDFGIPMLPARLLAHRARHAPTVGDDVTLRIGIARVQAIAVEAGDPGTALDTRQDRGAAGDRGLARDRALEARADDALVEHVIAGLHLLAGMQHRHARTGAGAGRA